MAIVRYVEQDYADFGYDRVYSGSEYFELDYVQLDYVEYFSLKTGAAELAASSAISVEVYLNKVGTADIAANAQVQAAGTKLKTGSATLSAVMTPIIIPTAIRDITKTQPTWDDQTTWDTWKGYIWGYEGLQLIPEASLSATAQTVKQLSATLNTEITASINGGLLARGTANQAVSTALAATANATKTFTASFASEFDQTVDYTRIQQGSTELTSTVIIRTVAGAEIRFVFTAADLTATARRFRSSSSSLNTQATITRGIATAVILGRAEHITTNFTTSRWKLKLFPRVDYYYTLTVPPELRTWGVFEDVRTISVAAETGFIPVFEELTIVPVDEETRILRVPYSPITGYQAPTYRRQL